MVAYTQIKSSLSTLTSSTIPQTSLFVGGTSGIGKYTLRSLVVASSTLGNLPIRIYLTVRPSSLAQTEVFVSSLREINPHAEIILLQGEISLLSEVRRLSSLILSKEESESSSLDFLFLSAGYAPPSNKRDETSEGLEVAQSLEYYSRILFIQQLLPLLKRKNGRVISIGGGGLERPSSIPDVDDLGMKGQQSRGLMGYKAQGQYLAMNTLGMEVLARDNKEVVFIHAWPGIVNTGNVWRTVEDKNSWMGWVVWLLLDPLIRLLGRNEEEVGERYLFMGCSGLYGGNDGERVVRWDGKEGKSTEGGLWLADYNGECTPNEKNVKVLREKAQEKVWSHTMEVLGPYL
ncbi:hypothetical protein QBC43DRAFT_264588 [Cladorrhinum sp. PSN259]|nr:hypothetical protein QBC43DRAFT_264588 [Cladorrhinum sp. PSN259]